MRYIELTDKELLRLQDLAKNTKNPVVHKRAYALILSNIEQSMKSIAKECKMSRTTLYYFFNAWEAAKGEDKFKTLYIAKGRGAKPKLEPIKDKLPALVKKYNQDIEKILQILEEEYDIKVCSLTLKKYLKKETE